MLSLLIMFVLAGTEPISPHEGAASALLIPEVLTVAGVAPSECGAIRQAVIQCVDERTEIRLFRARRAALIGDYRRALRAHTHNPADPDAELAMTRLASEIANIEASMANAAMRIRDDAFVQLPLDVQDRFARTSNDVPQGVPLAWRVLDRTRDQWHDILAAAHEVERARRQGRAADPVAVGLVRSVTESADVLDAEARLRRDLPGVRAAMRF
ncbi:MAG: hypothetical protein AAFX79_00070 [Planctomycetota bacterium]